MPKSFSGRVSYSTLSFLLVLAALFVVDRFHASAAEGGLRMRDFIGINGHTVQFKPALYRPVCGLVRDYHPVEWDLGKATAKAAPFPLARNGVDWSQVYGSWRINSWTIDACLMFETVAQADWNNLEADAKAYAEAFAREFGPSGKRRLIDSVEVGNEPGKWSDADYRRIFKAMAEGLRAGDPKLTISTCNLTTGKSGEYEKSVSCIEQLPGLFDVLNIHTYAQVENWPTWRRSFPEDPKLAHYLQDIDALCRWRDEHAQGKPVWITEFGYDSSTKPSEQTGDFAKWIGVTDKQQAQWLVRSLLVFSAMPVQRAYIYFFNDEDQPRLHASSGITRFFNPKPSFFALQHLQRILGEYWFERVVTNVPGRLRAQAYRNASKNTVWAVWSPTGEGKFSTFTFDKVPGKLVEVQRMPYVETPSTGEPPVIQGPDGRLEVEIDESPVYLRFQAQ